MARTACRGAGCQTRQRREALGPEPVQERLPDRRLALHLVEGRLREPAVVCLRSRSIDVSCRAAPSPRARRHDFFCRHGRFGSTALRTRWAPPQTSRVPIPLSDVASHRLAAARAGARALPWAAARGRGLEGRQSSDGCGQREDAAGCLGSGLCRLRGAAQRLFLHDSERFLAFWGVFWGFGTSPVTR